ncbi:MAG: O-antigen ligase family protein, partial [Clostridia bacterium]|nr:O-antigen ligase family protein [Clostridia bacterium]
LPVMLLSMLISFGMLWLFATRLAYIALVINGVGFIITLLITGRENKKPIIALVAATLVFIALFPVSPMYENQKKVAENAVKKQENINRLISECEESLKNEDITEDEFRIKRLEGAYTEYLEGLVERFGLEKTVLLYNYSEKASDICDVRLMKNNYNSMLMEENGIGAKLFGIEYAALSAANEVLDAEKDFHGIYYLCGAVGLVLILAFLSYFIFLIAVSLIKKPKAIFNSDSAAFGISLINLLLHVYATAGVLRRPNASFYLSIVLAVVFYLVKINQNSETKGKTHES